MSGDLGPETLLTLKAFVDQRIEAIASGDRARIDVTYASHNLRLRNQYNDHDYATYLRVIENGFGNEVQGYDIHAIESPDQVPLYGLVSWPLPPQFAARVWTTDERATLWLLRIGDEGPRIVLPAFGGRTFDELVSGGVRPPKAPRPNVLERTPKFPRKAASAAQAAPKASLLRVRRFAAEPFAAALAERIALELNGIAPQLQFDRLRAMTLDCHPWNGAIFLSLLTEREEPRVQGGAKWEHVANWRYFDFPSTPNQHWPYAHDLIEQASAFYQEAIANGEGPDDRMDTLLKACAAALTSTTVANALNQYGIQRAPDFELGVFDPDNASSPNYCAPI